LFKEKKYVKQRNKAETGEREKYTNRSNVASAGGVKEDYTQYSGGPLDNHNDDQSKRE